MRVKIISLIVIGILLSLGGGLGSFFYIKAVEKELNAARASLRTFGEIVTVPVPSHDTMVGAVLTAADFVQVKLPKSYLPANILVTLPTPAEGDTLIGLTALKSGEILLQADVALSTAKSEFGLIPSLNNRIFALSPRNLAEFGDGVTVGSLVDVVWTKNLGGGMMESRLIAAALRVRMLPDDSAPAPGEAGANALSGKLIVEGSASEAMLNVIAEQSGFFHILISDGSRELSENGYVVGEAELQDLPLALRAGPAGEGAIGSTLATITGGSKRAVCATAVIRGGVRSVAEVPC